MISLGGRENRIKALEKLQRRLSENAETKCFEYTGSRNYHGYGQIGFGGRSWLAHRLMYAIVAGGIPERHDRNDDKTYILHHCDNPSCCNPRHLYLGSRADNGRDMAERCRVRIGYWRSNDPSREFKRFGRVYWEINGCAKTLDEWASHYKVNHQTLDGRLRAGWPEDMLNAPPHSGQRGLAGRSTYRRISGDPSLYHQNEKTETAA